MSSDSKTTDVDRPYYERKAAKRVEMQKRRAIDGMLIQIAGSGSAGNAD